MLVLLVQIVITHASTDLGLKEPCINEQPILDSTVGTGQIVYYQMTIHDPIQKKNQTTALAVVFDDVNRIRHPGTYWTPLPYPKNYTADELSTDLVFRDIISYRPNHQVSYDASFGSLFESLGVAPDWTICVPNRRYYAIISSVKADLFSNHTKPKKVYSGQFGQFRSAGGNNTQNGECVDYFAAVISCDANGTAFEFVEEIPSNRYELDTYGSMHKKGKTEGMYPYWENIGICQNWNRTDHLDSMLCNQPELNCSYNGVGLARSAKNKYLACGPVGNVTFPPPLAASGTVPSSSYGDNTTLPSREPSRVETPKASGGLLDGVGDWLGQTADGVGKWTGEQADNTGHALGNIYKGTRKAIEPGFCETNGDCGSGEICKPGLGCSAPPQCRILRENETSTSQIRLLLIGDGFRTDEDLKKAANGVVDWEGNNYGLMSLEPFKSRRDGFDIYYVRSNQSIMISQVGDDQQVDEVAVEAQSSACGDIDEYILLSRQSFRSYAYAGRGDAYVSLGSEWLSQYQNRLTDHEFGHSFGGLMDEYVENKKGSQSGPPNCAGSREEAQNWWGDVPGTGYYDGCSYVSGNIRPTENSVMRDQYLLWDGYGPVNERTLRSRLDELNR